MVAGHLECEPGACKRPRVPIVRFSFILEGLYKHCSRGVLFVGLGTTVLGLLFKYHAGTSICGVLIVILSSWGHVILPLELYDLHEHMSVTMRFYISENVQRGPRDPKHADML